jgi:hypothetical protein
MYTLSGSAPVPRWPIEHVRRASLRESQLFYPYCATLTVQSGGDEAECGFADGDPGVGSPQGRPPVGHSVIPAFRAKLACRYGSLVPVAPIWKCTWF